MKIRLSLLTSAALGLTALAIACSGAPASPGPVASASVATPVVQPEPVRREVPAPIESVSLNVMTNRTPNSTLVVVSGLPNACFEFSRYASLSRSRETISLDVLNVDESVVGQGCAEIYRMVTNDIPLPLEYDIEACESYAIVVNGESQLVQAIAPTVRCSQPGTPAAADEPGDIAPDQGDTVTVFAPIDGVEISVAESFPLQYFLNVKSGLPNGCARFDGYTLNREGDTITVEVTNLKPASKDLMCTMIYGTVETNIPLGTDFEPGRTYTVNVNDFTKSFVGEGVLPDDGMTKPPLAPSFGSAFSIELGEEVRLGGEEGIAVEFSSVLEDSRCPANVVCIWAGRATVAISLTTLADGATETVELALGDTAGRRSDAGVVRNFKVQLLQLDPYPGTGAAGPLSVTLSVTEAGP